MLAVARGRGGAEDLANWSGALLDKIPVGGLLARNPVAYKWKAPLSGVDGARTDVLAQARLDDAEIAMLSGIGRARPPPRPPPPPPRAPPHGGAGGGRGYLLRSGFETLVRTLTYLNLLMQQVLDGKLNFHVFCEKTTRLLLGSRNNGSDARFHQHRHRAGESVTSGIPGIMAIYADLSRTRIRATGGYAQWILHHRP